MNPESTDLKLAVAEQLRNYTPCEADQPASENPYQALTLGEMRRQREFTEKPPQLIEGLVHRGTQILTAGASKAKKTWFTMQMATAVAHGTEFLGHATTQDDVLVIDYELMKPFLYERAAQVAAAMGVDPDSPRLRFLPLEGVKWNPENLIDYLRNHRFGLITIDPLYKLLGARSENDSSDMVDLLSEIDNVISATGATVAITHHFRKGDLSSISPMDRASGSGVLARDPDTIFTLSRASDEELGHDHSEWDCILRNMPPQETRVIRYDYPLWHTTDLSPQEVSATKQFDIVKLASALPEDGATMREWSELIASKCRIKWSGPLREFLKKEATRGRFIHNDNGVYYPTKDVRA